MSKANIIGGELRIFFDDLQKVSKIHEEMTDTDVMESIHITLSDYLIWDRALSIFPVCFSMFSEDGDVAVGKAVRRFIESALNNQQMASIPLGQARLNLLQDRSVKSESGLEYDEFFGHRDTPLPPNTVPPRMFVKKQYS